VKGMNMPPPAKPKFADLIAVIASLVLLHRQGASRDGSIGTVIVEGEQFATEIGRKYPALCRYMDDV